MKESLLLVNPKNDGNVVGITIRGSGFINGEARISLMTDGKPYKTEKLNGKVNFNWGSDWYSESAELVYVPAAVTSGSLVVQYSFRTL